MRVLIIPYAQTSDFGVRDVSYRVMTHLGHVLQVGRRAGGKEEREEGGGGCEWGEIGA